MKRQTKEIRKRSVLSPEHVENFAVRRDSDENVRHRDVLELCVLGVGKEDLS
jgi:hypothetical protein